ncbi:MAG TPA: carboxypeptidase-like regulatory domain-containing protein, partial [Blastocatellia bacterium]|nr:carboxypeptidase-like regulatory domain-containing protein [Blastocatellia bacterium]
MNRSRILLAVILMALGAHAAPRVGLQGKGYCGKTRDLAATSAREAACAPRMAAFAQQAAAEDDKQAGRRNGVITGRVVTADGQPLAETQIVAFGPNIKLGEPQQVATDEEGNFKLTGLRPGVYQLTA